MPLPDRFFRTHVPPDHQPLSAGPVPERGDVRAEQRQFQLHVQVRARVRRGPLPPARPLPEEPLPERGNVPGASRRLPVPVRARVRGRPVPERGGLLRGQAVRKRRYVREPEERLPVRVPARVRRQGLQPVRQRVRTVAVRQRRDVRDHRRRGRRRFQVRVSRRLHGGQLHGRAADHAGGPVQARVRRGPGTARDGAGVRQRRADGRAVRVRAGGRTGRHRGGAVHEEPPAPRPKEGRRERENAKRTELHTQRGQAGRPARHQKLVGPAAGHGPRERVLRTVVLRRAQQDTSAAAVSDASPVVVVAAAAETAQHRPTK